MIPLLTADEMRSLEQRFVAAGGDLTDLMRRAGREVAARIAPGKSVLVLAGPGNNGGDAVEVARVLRERGEEVAFYSFGRPEAPELPGVRSEDDPDFVRLRTELGGADVVVDGLLGTGGRPPEGRLETIIELVNAARDVERAAIDVPSGVDTDTGAVKTVAVHASRTVTFGLPKRGLWSYPGRAVAGQIDVADIGLDVHEPRAGCSLIEPEDIALRLPRRREDWNKGRSGTVIAIGGSSQFPGAPALMAVAAYRAGAGLVQVFVPGAIQSVVAEQAPEPVFSSPNGSDLWLGPAHLEAVAHDSQRAGAFAMGPGLGRHPDTKQFVLSALRLFRELQLPGVLDADGLNLVAEVPHWWDAAPENLVVTPHPGEMARLLQCSVDEVQSDRFSAASRAASEWGIVVVLKGSSTLIAHRRQGLLLNATGGPNLGTAGTGDVLTGVISSLMAQGMEPHDAAMAGVWLHGKAGDSLRAELGDAGTMASDLWHRLPIERMEVEKLAAVERG